MSIREAIAERPAVWVGISAAVIVLALIFTLDRLLAGPPRAEIVQGYYTTDDGQTMFADKADLLAPFDHNGQPAYDVSLYTCDGGKTKFAGYLERYTSAAKTRLESEAAAFNAGKTHAPPLRGPRDMEIKKPGSGNPWVNRADPVAARQIMNVRCPNGDPADLVLP